MPEHTPAPTAARGVYGHALYLAFSALLPLHIAWALAPDSALSRGFWPQRYWAVAIPVLALVALAMFALLAYPALSLAATPTLDDIRTVTDGNARKAMRRVHGGVPGVSDINISDVCRHLYAE